VKFTLNILEKSSEAADRRWPGHMFGGRVRTSTVVLILLFIGVASIYFSYRDDTYEDSRKNHSPQTVYVPVPQQPAPPRTVTYTPTPTTTETTTPETTPSPTPTTTTSPPFQLPCLVPQLCPSSSTPTPTTSPAQQPPPGPGPVPTPSPPAR
jgi:hypothetical protein